VILDGRPIGKIGNEETQMFKISSGKHSLYLKIDFGRSKTIEFQISHQQSAKFVCASNYSGWRVLLVGFGVLFRPHRYIWLEQKE
jgi:hypothetical protein